jgi:hypothetical protein
MAEEAALHGWPGSREHGRGQEKDTPFQDLSPVTCFLQPSLTFCSFHCLTIMPSNYDSSMGFNSLMKSEPSWSSHFQMPHLLHWHPSTWVFGEYFRSKLSTRSALSCNPDSFSIFKANDGSLSLLSNLFPAPSLLSSVTSASRDSPFLKNFMIKFERVLG